MDPREIRKRAKERRQDFQMDRPTDPDHPVTWWVCGSAGCREAVESPLESRQCPECGHVGFYPVNNILFRGW